jgi:hypothetical protein
MISLKKINLGGKSLSPPKATTPMNNIAAINKNNMSPKVVSSRFSEKIYNDIKVKINSVSPRHATTKDLKEK